MKRTWGLGKKIFKNNQQTHHVLHLESCLEVYDGIGVQQTLSCTIADTAGSGCSSYVQYGPMWQKC